MILLMIGMGIALSLAMAGGWWFQWRMGNAGWVDVVWTFATGAVAAGGALWPLGMSVTLRSLCLALMAAVWAARLGLHLRARVRSRPEDARYAGFRRDWGENFQWRLFWFLQIQAAAAWLLAIAMAVAARNPAQGFRWIDAVGLAILVVSIVGAGIADRQLACFAARPENKGGVCDSGLWSWSRHPNYFFEFLGWCAWPLFAIGSDWGRDWPWGWLALAAPALMYWLLVHVSGIPPLEKSMRESRGDAWLAYARRVSAFVPMPPKSEVSP